MTLSSRRKCCRVRSNFSAPSPPAIAPPSPITADEFNSIFSSVTPTKVGVQPECAKQKLDSGVRRNDDGIRQFLFVTPTKVGVQLGDAKQKLDSGLRRNDDEGFACAGLTRIFSFVTPTKVGVQ